jgi:hypothetical protein
MLYLVLSAYGIQEGEFLRYITLRTASPRKENVRYGPRYVTLKVCNPTTMLYLVLLVCLPMGFRRAKSYVTLRYIMLQVCNPTTMLYLVLSVCLPMGFRRANSYVTNCKSEKRKCKIWTTLHYVKGL